MSPETPTGVLCMAYGSPSTEAEIEAYYSHIRGGRKPSAEALEELTARYCAIGGSPLTAITRAQAAALGERLRLRTFVGMKHAPPFIADGAAEAKRAGIQRLVGLPLAPHFAEMSVGAYGRALAAAWDRELVFIPGVHDHSAFISVVRKVNVTGTPGLLFIIEASDYGILRQDLNGERGDEFLRVSSHDSGDIAALLGELAGKVCAFIGGDGSCDAKENAGFHKVQGNGFTPGSAIGNSGDARR